MHISEGILPAAHALALTSLAAPAVLLGSIRMKHTLTTTGDPSFRNLLTVGSALVFACTVLPIPMPLFGISSHLCMTGLLALLVGPLHVILPVALILAIQAVGMGHGGLTSLGANILTLGVIGPGLAFFLSRTVATFLRPGRRTLWGIATALAVSSMAVYVADAAVLAIAFQSSSPDTPAVTQLHGPG